MKLTKIIPSSVTRALGKTKLKIKTNSPEILIIAGCIGCAASIIAACKATLKVNDILDASKEDVKNIHAVAENPEFANDYTEDDKKKDLLNVYVKTGVKLVKLYAPTAIIFGLSLASILTSNKIMRKRNTILAGAYAALDKSYKEYRNRVVDKFGKEADHELLTKDTKANKLESENEKKSGEEKSENKTKSDNVLNPFAAHFDEYSKNHVNDMAMNEDFIRGILRFANTKLIQNGFLFLNDILNALGLPETEEGQLFGWIYDKNDPELHNHISFGLDDESNISAIEFKNRQRNDVWLFFNVDGLIVNRFMKYSN